MLDDGNETAHPVNQSSSTTAYLVQMSKLALYAAVPHCILLTDDLSFCAPHFHSNSSVEGCAIRGMDGNLRAFRSYITRAFSLSSNYQISSIWCYKSVPATPFS